MKLADEERNQKQGQSLVFALEMESKQQKSEHVKLNYVLERPGTTVFSFIQSLPIRRR